MICFWGQKRLVHEAGKIIILWNNYRQPKIIDDFSGLGIIT